MNLKKKHVVNFQKYREHHLVKISRQSDYFSKKINFSQKFEITFFFKFTKFRLLNIFLMIASVKQILHNANLFIWQISRDLEKFQGIWRSFDGFGEVSRDFRSFKEFGEVSWEKFREISKSFEGFGEVLRDFEKF